MTKIKNKLDEKIIKDWLKKLNSFADFCKLDEMIKSSDYSYIDGKCFSAQWSSNDDGIEKRIFLDGFSRVITPVGLYVYKRAGTPYVRMFKEQSTSERKISKRYGILPLYIAGIGDSSNFDIHVMREIPRYGTDSNLEIIKGIYFSGFCNRSRFVIANQSIDSVDKNCATEICFNITKAINSICKYEEENKS